MSYISFCSNAIALQYSVCNHSKQEYPYSFIYMFFGTNII